MALGSPSLPRVSTAIHWQRASRYPGEKRRGSLDVVFRQPLVDNLFFASSLLSVRAPRRDALLRQFLIARSQLRMSEEPLIAVFVDFENLAIGVRDMKVGHVPDSAGSQAAAGKGPHRLQAGLLRLEQLRGRGRASFTARASN